MEETIFWRKEIRKIQIVEAKWIKKINPERMSTKCAAKKITSIAKFANFLIFVLTLYINPLFEEKKIALKSASFNFLSGVPVFNQNLL